MEFKTYKRTTYVDAITFNGHNHNEISKFVNEFVQRDKDNPDKARFYVRGKKFTLFTGMLVTRAPSLNGEMRISVFKPESFFRLYTEVDE